MQPISAAFSPLLFPGELIHYRCRFCATVTSNCIAHDRQLVQCQKNPTTEFGDMTLINTSGQLFAVLIMIFGISLFLRLLETIFHPDKIQYEGPACGLTRMKQMSYRIKPYPKIFDLSTICDLKVYLLCLCLGKGNTALPLIFAAAILV